MELKKERQRQEKGVEAAMQELLCALSLNIIRVRRDSVCEQPVNLGMEADAFCLKCATGVCLYVSHRSVVSFLSWGAGLIPGTAAVTHQP